MTKQKIIPRRGKYITLNTPYKGVAKQTFNVADNGFSGLLNDSDKKILGQIFKDENKLNKFIQVGDKIGEGISKASGYVGTALNGLNAFNETSQIADLDSQRNQLASMNNFISNAGNYDSLTSDVNNIQSWNDIDYNTARGSNGLQRTGSILKNIGSTFASAKGGLFSKAGQALFTGAAGLVGNMFGNKKARDAQAELNAAGDIAENRQINTIIDQADKINNNTFNNQLLQYAAFGGNLFNDGGTMNNFSNGTTEINTGGTHEQNPLEGVPMGVDSQGTPNLVEEGEVIRDGYVYSNRLAPTTEMLKSVGLPTKYNKYTYAKIAEELNKESKERPNDPISLKGINANFEKLKTIHEQSRMEAQEKTEKNIFSGGGKKREPLFPDMTKITHETNPELFRDAVMTGEKVTPPNTEENNYPTWMRYTPIYASGALALSDALGLTNRPDYSTSEAALLAAKNQSGIQYTPLGDYIERNPLDRNYYMTQLANQSLAAQRAANNSANRYQANAMSLANNYTIGENIGKTLMQMDQYNNTDARQVAEFNRATNQANAQASLEEQRYNSEMNRNRLASIVQAAQMRAAEKLRSDNAKSLNLTNFYDNLAGLGQENMALNMVRNNKSEYYGINSDGSLYYKPAFFDANDETKAQIEKITGIPAGKAGTKHSKGGYLTIKNKKRR